MIQKHKYDFLCNIYGLKSAYLQKYLNLQSCTVTYGVESQNYGKKSIFEFYHSNMFKEPVQKHQNYMPLK